jgi:hypothetical protein
MISFGASDDDMNDSLSLAASDAEEFIGHGDCPRPLAAVLFM